MIYKKLFILSLIFLSLVGKSSADEILDLYKHLHSNPELSWQEFKTSNLLADKMEGLGFTVTRNFAKTGVVSIFKNGKGPVLMIRADMDALPVEEKTGLEYSSKIKMLNDDKIEVSVMHACGHDVHMAVAVGTAKELINSKSKWSGTLMVIFQPAEEVGQGSAKMLEEGLFDKFPRPDFNLALHVGSFPAGKVTYTKGYAMANVDMADITIYGVVGSIHGGSKHNIIPDEVKLQLTMRSYTDEVREEIISKIKRIIEGEAISLGIPENKMPTLKLRDQYTPALYNTPDFVDDVVGYIEKSIGKENIFESSAVMGGEDFGRYGRVEPKIPTFLFWLGASKLEVWEKSVRGEIDLPGIQSPFFAPDPIPTLSTGIKVMTAAAIGVFNDNK